MTSLLFRSVQNSRNYQLKNRWNFGRWAFPVMEKLVLLFLLAAEGFAATNLYVDPNYTGSTRNGSATNPWQSMSDSGATTTPWTVVNTDLASGPVTVYFAAQTSAGSGTANSVTDTITINRTDTSGNLLTLDGISKYNTNETSPSWITSSTPSPCDPRGATGGVVNCSWYQAPKFTITGTLPITSNASNTDCYSSITIQGFKLDRTEGQIIDAAYIKNLTIQYIEGYATSGGSNSYGPGIYVGPANNGPCKNGSTFSGIDNVTVQYNYIHDTYEDCLYDGASTPDPMSQQTSEATNEGLTCGSACSTGANHLIQYNEIDSCAEVGGTENVGINIKDGHSGLTVRDNLLRPTKAGFSSSALGPAINLESSGTIDGNYIEAPATVGIAAQTGWNNSIGRSNSSITNNVIVNVNSGSGHNSGIEVFGPSTGANQLWQQMNIYNNTVYNAGASSWSCIAVDSGSMASGTANVENNIVDTCGSGGIFIASGLANARDYNEYYSAGTCPPSGEGSHGVCGSPDFASTSTPYEDTNFEIQSGSPALGAGLNLATTFTDDYLSATRPGSGSWTIGAFQGTPSTNLYVDPNYTGSTRNGSATNPWQSMSDSGATTAPWTVVNSDLASGPVTVYFAAQTSAGTQTANSVTTTITINRTDTSGNVLTLDGIGRYNTNESSPSWTTSTSPSPCDPRGATGGVTNCSWYQAPKFTITGTLPITSNASNTSCYSNITIQGFKLDRTEGQIIDAAYIKNLTIQYVEAYATSGGSYGPGVYVGPANNGPCKAGSTFSGVDNVTMQYNYIHDTYEDCLYDGSSTPDAPGYPSSEYTNLGLTCTTACATGANHLIQYNEIDSCASAGGSENVGINIKDGHSGFTLRDNLLRTTKAGFNSSAIGPAINLESSGTIDGNYIEAPATIGIAAQLGWNNSVGRSNSSITNNVIVNVNNGFGNNTGIEVFGPGSGASQLWQQMNLYNNTVYNAGSSTTDPCISVDSGSMASGTANVENNIVDTCGAGGIVIASGLANARDYNEYYSAGTCPPSGEGSHGVCGNPDFMSTSTPYNDTNFEVQSSSPALGAGLNLTTIFTDDYLLTTRPGSGSWTIGAFQTAGN